MCGSLTTYLGEGLGGALGEVLDVPSLVVRSTMRALASACRDSIIGLSRRVALIGLAWTGIDCTNGWQVEHVGRLGCLLQFDNSCSRHASSMRVGPGTGLRERS